MRNLLYLAIAALVISSCNFNSEGEKSFSIQGSVDQEFSGTAYLLKRESGEWSKLDSTPVESGVFTFSGTILLPEMYYIKLSGTDNYAGFFIAPGELTFKASLEDFRNPVITGSAAQDEYIQLKEKAGMFDDMYSDAWNKIKEARESGDTAGEKRWEAEYDQIDEQFKQFVIDYAVNNPNSVVSAYYLMRNSYNYDEHELEPVVQKFNPSLRQSVYLIQLNERIQILKRVAIGQPAIDFTMNDMDGNPVTLSSLYGKYLLVDFWASWCGPCRRENPNVVAAYSGFKDKGFDILGVSFDQKHEKWIEAVKTDSLTWHHVSDLQYWGNAAGKLYGINSIPSNILLDPNGIIIAKNLRGQDLHNKLAELFN